MAEDRVLAKEMGVGGGGVWREEETGFLCAQEILGPPPVVTGGDQPSPSCWRSSLGMSGKFSRRGHPSRHGHVLAGP